MGGRVGCEPDAAAVECRIAIFAAACAAHGDNAEGLFLAVDGGATRARAAATAANEAAETIQAAASRHAAIVEELRAFLRDLLEQVSSGVDSDDRPEERIATLRSESAALVS